jgi:hypothetical protein
MNTSLLKYSIITKGYIYFIIFNNEQLNKPWERWNNSIEFLKRNKLIYFRSRGQGQGAK